MDFKSILRNLTVVGEKETFRKIAEIVEVGRKANSLLLETSKTYWYDRSWRVQEVRLLEKEADELSFRIKRDLMQGAVAPSLLDNLLKCVDMADGLVDDYYYLSREFARIDGVRREMAKTQAPFELDPVFVQMFELADKAITILEGLLSASDLTKIREERKEIEAIEEEGDETKDNSFDRLYHAASQLSYLEMMHYSEAIHKLDDILDGCEDLSDLVVSIMTSISR